MMKDLLRQIFLSQQIKSASPDQAHLDERHGQTNLLKPVSPDQAQHDERSAQTNLINPADKICIS
jgi:hypothetical protein